MVRLKVAIKLWPATLGGQRDSRAGLKPFGGRFAGAPAAELHTKTPDDRGMSVVNIFRAAGGRIVEHRDVQQAAPETSASGNTMF